MRFRKPPSAKFVLIFAVVAGLLKFWQHVESRRPASSHQAGSASTSAAREAEHLDVERAPADFDFYLLALSWHPAFCADGNDDKPECGVLEPHPLALHGLWPEKLSVGAYPHDCRAPRLDL